MRNPFVFLVILVVDFGVAAHALAETARIGASKDNTLYESQSGALSNGAGNYLFSGRTARTNETRRGLIAFDIGSVVPAGSTITGVELSLHMSMTISGAQPVSLHRVTADWGEGGSIAGGNEGAGGAARVGDATWLHTFFDTAQWTNVGGDFAAVASATTSVAGVGTYTWTTPELAADVQFWLDNGRSNFGWLLKMDETVSGNAKRFGSSENPDRSVQPSLLVTYVVPAPGVLACLGGVVAIGGRRRLRVA